MASELYIAIFGLFGVGKTTLARGIIASDGGLTQYDNYCVTNGGRYTFFGRYPEGSKYGGSDLVKGNTSAVLNEVFLKSTTPVFVSEGMRTASFGAAFLRTFYLAKRQAIIFLDCKYEVSLERIENRSGKTGDNSNRWRDKTFRNTLNKHASIGTPVYRIDANQSKETVLKQSLEVIRRLTGWNGTTLPGGAQK